MAKISKVQIENLRDLKSRGGAVMASEWVNGHGNYITAKAIPPFAQRIERGKMASYPLRIQKVFTDHPRCQAVVAIVDMRSANMALRAGKA